MARVVITGSAGLIGGIVYDMLRNQGDEVVGIDRPHDERIARGRNVDDEEAYSRLDLSGDLAKVDLGTLTDWFTGADSVIHLAADADPSNISRSMLETNIGSTQNVLRAACKARVNRVILASSGLVQVTLEKHLEKQRLIGGKQGVGIDSPYGLTKIIGEVLGRSYANQYGLDVVSVRIGTVIPDDEEHNRRGGRLMATAFLQEDVRRFFKAVLVADLSSCNGHLITAAQSNSPTRFIDLEPGISTLGWKPVEWPFVTTEEV